MLQRNESMESIIKRDPTLTAEFKKHLGKQQAGENLECLKAIIKFEEHLDDMIARDEQDMKTWRSMQVKAVELWKEHVYSRAEQCINLGHKDREALENRLGLRYDSEKQVTVSRYDSLETAKKNLVGIFQKMKTVVVLLMRPSFQDFSRNVPEAQE